jgi:REP element-mobilizing transposase RayT
MWNRTRKSIRIRGYDYRRPGAYFVTVVTRRRERILGWVVNGGVLLSFAGKAAHSAWHEIPGHCPGVTLDAFVVMPDHIHGVLFLQRSLLTLGQIVGLFKSAASNAINRARGTPGAPVWQTGFYERIIHDDQEWWAVRRYIADNPMQWVD